MSYIPPKIFEKLDFDYVTHRFEGHAVTLALNRAANDRYTGALRQGLLAQLFVPFILRRAKRSGRTLKAADFGANVGVVSLPLAANGVRVLAVEAHPKNFMALATAARASGGLNVVPVNMAAFDGPGLITLSGSSAWATAGVERGGLTVPCDTLVSILATYGFSDVDVIKLDIEGAELPALHGADAFVLERPETEVIFESNNHTCHFFGYDRQDLLHWFESRGFSTYVFCPDGLMAIRCGDPQAKAVVDVLATKRSVSDLTAQGESFVAMTDDYVLRELIKSSRSKNPHVRQHFITEAQRLGDGYRKSPLWVQIADAMAAITATTGATSKELSG